MGRLRNSQFRLASRQELKMLFFLLLRESSSSTTLISLEQSGGKLAWPWWRNPIENGRR
jgi:hypothetical protein